MPQDKEDPAPKAEPSSAAPPRKSLGNLLRAASPEGPSGAGSSGSPIKIPNAPWANALKEAQKDALEERQRKTRMAESKLSYPELFFEREQVQARNALSNIDVLMRDVRRVRSRMKRGNRMLLDPNGNLLQSFDLLTLYALAYTVFITPYEIGFLSATMQPVTLDIMNYFITAIFGIGIILNFFTPFRASHLVGGAKIKSHKAIAIRYLQSWFILDVISTIPYEFIANMALYGAPRAPVVEVPANETIFQEDDAALMFRAAGNLRLVRLLRIMRLLKLGRIARASRIADRVADRLERYIAISYSTRTLVFWTLLMLILIHWFCCTWGLVAQEYGTLRNPELEEARLASFNLNQTDDLGSGGERRLSDLLAYDTDGMAQHPLIFLEEGTRRMLNSDGSRRMLKAALPVGGAGGGGAGYATDAAAQVIENCERGYGSCLSACERVLFAQLRNQFVPYTTNWESWLCRVVHEGKVPRDTEGEHLRVYAYTLQSFGMITPANTAEYFIFFIMSFIFLVMSNVFVGVVAAAQSEADPQTREFKKRMDELNHFLNDMRVPPELKRRTRDHFRFTRDLVRKQSYDQLYYRFSPRLRGDVLCHISLKTLKSVSYFETCERGFLNALSQKLTHEGYAQGEPIYHAEPTLSIVTRGTAVRGGKPITLSQYWGEDMIVTSAALRDSRPGAALTYVEIVCLTRTKLFETAKDWPESRHIIHIAATTIAMMRAPCLIANYLSREGKSHDQLNRALQSLGKQSNSEDKEFHAVMKQLNGGKPLRGFARELVQSKDGPLAKRAAEAVLVAGDEGKLLVDEDGKACNKEGDEVELAEDAEDKHLKAIGALKKMVDENNNFVKSELRGIHRFVVSLARAQGTAPAPAASGPNGGTGQEGPAPRLTPYRRKKQIAPGAQQRSCTQTPPATAPPMNQPQSSYEA